MQARSLAMRHARPSTTAANRGDSTVDFQSSAQAPARPASVVTASPKSTPQPEAEVLPYSFHAGSSAAPGDGEAEREQGAPGPRPLGPASLTRQAPRRREPVSRSTWKPRPADDPFCRPTTERLAIALATFRSSRFGPIGTEGYDRFRPAAVVRHVAVGRLLSHNPDHVVAVDDVAARGAFGRHDQVATEQDAAGPERHEQLSGPVENAGASRLRASTG